jgi:hypothetical protein
MGKKRRIARNPKKFGRKFGRKFNIETKQDIITNDVETTPLQEEASKSELIKVEKPAPKVIKKTSTATTTHKTTKKTSSTKKASTARKTTKKSKRTSVKKDK